MRYSNDIGDFKSERDSAVTLGKFDGLHRGHQRLIHEITRLQKKGLQSVVFTIAPEHGSALMTSSEKKSMLESYGIDWMIHCPFVQEILGMEPEQFISEILVKKIRAKYIVVGTDFRFGHNRSGDTELLKALQEKYDYRVVIIEKECYQNREISSTYIKEALMEGNIELVSELLGYDYSVKGIVVHGRQLGRKIGMPTVNLIPETRKILPPNGVYYSDVLWKNKKWHGMTNIGCKPTVDGSFLGVETYLYDVDQDLYDCEIDVRIRKFRRNEMKFDSIEALKTQMEQDIAAGRDYFS